jgi:parallel beta-helix repeat protein
MALHFHGKAKWLAGCLSLAVLLTGCGRPQDTHGKGKTIRVAQSGMADIIGDDNAALQKGADRLQAGDLLEIGPGTFAMNNSLFVPSGVTVRGTAGQTILKKNDGVDSPLAEDCDYGERQLRVAHPEKFKPGMGIAIKDDELSSGWDISVTTIQSIEGNLLHISPTTLRDYNQSEKKGRVQNTFPILCAINTEKVTLENLIVDGNKEKNVYLDGCRGGAIYFYNSRDGVVRDCVARNYNGDGISFQITENIQVINCESTGHAGYGVHPGTGSDRPLVKDCRLHDNGQIGLFLCWRVRHGQFVNNQIINNGQHGISIGHKDTDNLFLDNLVSGNKISGIYFRPETILNSGHRNTFRNNQIVNNGTSQSGYGVYVEPHAGSLLFEGNKIAETRQGAERTQRIGVYKTVGAGSVQLQKNQMDGHLEKDVVEATK